MLDTVFEVAEAPDEMCGGRGCAFEFSCAILAFGAEAVAGILEGVVDEFAAADDRAIGEVADAASQDLGEGDFADGFFLGFEEFGFCRLEFCGGHSLAFGDFAQFSVVLDPLFDGFAGIQQQTFAVFPGDIVFPEGVVGADAAVGPHGSNESGSRFLSVASWAAADGFAVAAPAIVGWVADDACADGIEVDVGGDGLSGDTVLDDDAFEAVFPEVAGAFVFGVVPHGVALEEALHELGEIVHAPGEAFVDGGDVGFGVFHDAIGDGFAGIGEFFGDEGDLCFGLDVSQAVKEFLI